MADCTDADSTRDLLETALPEGRIVSDLRAILAEAEGAVELDGLTIHASPDATIEVIARSAHSYELPIGFGDHFRALVAIGGVVRIEHGVPTAQTCFATLWYSAERRLMTVDFSKDMP